MIKICCISSIDEAIRAINSGVEAIGLVGPMPSGPGVIDNVSIRQIVQEVTSQIDTFLLTSELSAEKIVEHHSKTGTSTIQLVDRVDIEVYGVLRKELPGVNLVQVIHVLNDQDIGYARTIAPFVDRILLDSGNPNLKVKVLGGTGMTHDWSISKALVQGVNVPVLLAGGLRAENVEEAIHTVKPAGVDICSGVRRNGHLDDDKLARFVAKAKKALNSLSSS